MTLPRPYLVTAARCAISAARPSVGLWYAKVLVLVPDDARSIAAMELHVEETRVALAHDEDAVPNDLDQQAQVLFRELGAVLTGYEHLRFDACLLEGLEPVCCKALGIHESVATLGCTWTCTRSFDSRPLERPR